MDASVIVPIVVAIVMSLPGIYTAFVTMRKEESAIDKASQEAALELIIPLREEVSILRSRISELEKQLETKNKTIAEQNGRIFDLERMVSERDKRITTLQEEIDRLTERVEIVEKRKTRPIPPKA